MKKPRVDIASQFDGVPEFLGRLGVKKSEWQYATKKGWRLLMRPGWDLRVRTFACLQEYSIGYPRGGGEFAMMQVGKDVESDNPKFVPITPTAISARLLKEAVQAHRDSGRDIKPEDRSHLRVRAPNMRRMLASLETDDGAITTVTATKFLSPHESIRKLARADVRTLMTEGLSFEAALARQLIVPIRNLSPKDRQRLAGKSFIYVHAKPRPAAPHALMRRTDEDITLSQTNKEIHAVMTAAAQLAFKFLRAAGVNNPQLAEQLARLPQMVAYVDQLVTIETSRANLQGAIKEYLHPLIDAHKRGVEIDLPAAVAAPEPAAVQVPLFPPAIVPKSEPATPPAAADPPLVSQPRSSQPAESVRIPDAEFKRAVIAAFVDAGRKHPFPSQLRILDSLPDLARPVFLEDLKQSMARIKGPGVLESHVTGFVAAWPALRDKLEADRTAERRRQEARAIEDAPRPPEDLSGEWGTIKASLRKHVSPEGYDNWLRGTRQLSRPGASTSPLIEVPDQETLGWLTTEYAEIIDLAMADAGLAAPCYEVRLRTKSEVA